MHRHLWPLAFYRGVTVGRGARVIVTKNPGGRTHPGTGLGKLGTF